MRSDNDINIFVAFENKKITITGLTPADLLNLRGDWERRRFFHTELVDETNSVTYQFMNSYAVLQAYKMALDYTDNVLYTVSQ